MTDGYLMDADCIHGVEWYACAECERDALRAELSALKATSPDGPTKDQAWAGYRAAQGAVIDAGFTGDVSPRDAIEALSARLVALEARRCDGCVHAWRTDDFPPERPGYLWCGLVNHRQGNEAPMVMDARHLGLSVPQVHPSHSCAAWTEKP